VAINPKDQLVTLKGPLGNEYALNVQDPAQLTNIKKGDEVEATYTEAIALSVQSTPNSQP
jgi:Cu/Ag efflux protein CusF